MVKQGYKKMSIFQRIGEAIASQGKITVVPALTPDDGLVLTNSGFKKVGTMDLNGSLVDLYEVKITQVINTAPYQGIRVPHNDEPFPRSFPPKKYESTWPENYRLYNYGGTTSPTDIQYRGSITSLTDAAYNPLSILEDYFFPSDENLETNRRVFKIDLGDIPLDEQHKIVDSFKQELHNRKTDNKNW